MSKLFNGTTDLVTVTQQTAINNVGGSPGSKTAFAWIWLTAYGENIGGVSQGRIFDKIVTNGGWAFQTYADTAAGISGSFQLSVIGTTQGRAYALSGTLSLGKWWCVAGTYTPGDGGPRLYVGDLHTPMAEASYSAVAGTTRQDVAGYSSDAAQNLIIGNRVGADRSFAGKMAHLQLWGPNLTLAELETLRRNPPAAISGKTRVAYWAMPHTEAANACADSSGNGNNGTPTGTAAATSPVPKVIVQNASGLALFPIGPGFQPIADFAPWIGRGCNTMYGFRSDIDTIDAWTAACNSNNLYFIRPPRAVLADDASETRLLAWAHADEPDANGTPSSATAASDYATWKAAAPSLPVVLNLAGPLILNLENYATVPLATYLAYLPSCDWAANDIYPVATVKSPNFGKLELVEEAVDQLTLWSAKPNFAWVETSNQGAAFNNTAPTPGQVRAEMWSAIIHGARGIFFYPKHWTSGVVDDHDQTPTDVATEITAQTAIISALATVLQGAVNPAGVSATAAYPIEVGWRVADDDTPYVFAINLSGSQQTDVALTLTGITGDLTVRGESRSETISGGVLTDTFAANALHIYTTAADVEPSSLLTVLAAHGGFRGD